MRGGRVWLWLALVVVLAFSVPVGAVAGVRGSAPSSEPRPADPKLTAPIAFVADLTTGIQLFAQNPDTPAPPASTMKIVTALTARRIFTPDEQLTAAADDVLD